ncbi:hypothetical protein GGI15_002158 [Coemansia interrupta]|uniref:Uncharacterized protein n=1 Tax=Coemansia interrupta TaxID=1126814 RepID=A0A9W8LKZ8_9FUNG|nr:hypothetical protein GGI15_002158 [Coemansia interrupta]
MARKRGNKQKQAKNAKNNAKAQARALQELEDEKYLCELEEQAQNEAAVPSTADATGDESSSEAHGCGMADILAMTDKLLERIAQSLTEDMGVEGFEIDFKKIVAKRNADAANGINGSAAASNLPSVTENTSSTSKKDQEALWAMQAENERLRAQLAQREAEVDGLSRLIEAQKTELFVARSQVAQLDAFAVHEIRRIFNYISFPAGVSMLIQGLQRQYALREEHFAVVEQMLVMESQLWQEKCRLAEARELKAQVREAEEKEKRTKRLLLESEQNEHTKATTRQMEVEVKRKLGDCMLLFQTLVQCNIDVRETMNQLTKDLYVDVSALSGIRDAFKQMGQNKALQPVKMMLEQSRLGDTISMITAAENCGKHSLADCEVDSESAKHDLEPSMPKLLAAFPPDDMSRRHHVMVGESPRVIRMPRRRDSRAKDKASPPNNVSDKPISHKSPSKSETKPIVFPVPTGEFTFLSP